MKDKVAIITGASRGIGRAVAENLAEQGYHVVLVSRSKSELEKVQQEIEIKGGQASVYAVNVALAKEVKQCVADVVHRLGRVDVLFNNAGIFYPGTTELEDDQVEKMLDINLMGAIFVGNAVARQMKKQKSGYIINLSSIGGKIAGPGYGGYNASKFGFVGYGDALAQEMIFYNVKVTTLCPGMVNTEIANDFARRTKTDPNELIQPEDIAKVVNFLLGLGKNITIKDMIVGSTVTFKKHVENNIKMHGE